MFFQAVDGIRVAHWLLEFRRVLFRSSLVYSAVGTANLGFKPLDFKSASLDPKLKDKVGDWFISTNDPALTETQKEADGKNPLSTKIRAELLQIGRASWREKVCQSV